jgi:hypothetical protein
MEWWADEIIGHCWVGKNLQLQVKWVLGDVTWEPLANVNELAALDNYLVLHGVTNPSELLRKR